MNRKVHIVAAFPNLLLESCQRAFACSGLLQTAPQFSPPYITSALLPILSISNEVVSNETVRLLANNSLVPEEQVSGASHIVLYWYTYKTSQAEEWSEKVFGQLDEMRKGFTNANYYLYSYAKGVLFLLLSTNKNLEQAFLTLKPPSLTLN